jgi:hypothetical protein
MQSLLQSLQDYDLGHLKIILELWGIDYLPKEALETSKYIAEAMIEERFVAEILDSLPPSAGQVLNELIQRKGVIPVADLSRKHGSIREMGPGRRDREKPWRSPSSPLEILWYRGLIGRTFTDSPMGAQEVIFIPVDLLKNLPAGPEGRAKDVKTLEIDFQPIVPEIIQFGSDACVDDATTLLAFLRKGFKISNGSGLEISGLTTNLYHPNTAEFLLQCLIGVGVVDKTTREPDPDYTREFLDLPHSEAHHNLTDAWRRSSLWNDLKQVPGLSSAGDSWPNDPLESRAQFLKELRGIPINQWWGLSSFIQKLKDSNPSFQRPAGDFNSWYLYRSGTGEFLPGFEHWDDIEGAYLRYIFSGPLFWLGIVDLGYPGEGFQPSAFRLNKFASLFLEGPQGEFDEHRSEMAIIDSDGTIKVPRGAVRAHRYQMARIAEWIHLEGDKYSYRITPSSLTKASEQALTIIHIHAILDSICERIPPHVLQALERWDAHGNEVDLRSTFLLRVSTPEVLDELQSQRTTAKFIKEILGPKSCLVLERHKEGLYSAALKRGIFIDLA